MSEYIQEEIKVSNECPNIFALKKSTNIWENEYICQKIFEYIQISEYSLHTGIYIWILSFVSFPGELDLKRQQRYFT